MINIESENETLAGYHCPCCGYPVVREEAGEQTFEVCYHCGWLNEGEGDELVI